MKSLLTSLAIFTAISGFSQLSEDLIPKQAVSVFSLNNINLLQKISLDDLVKYEFMEEVQQELFDGSTRGKTIKDLGINFDQKLNVFNGIGENYEVTGLTFGVDDRNKLFDIFDDYTPMKSNYPGVDFYISYFNRIAISGNIGILYRVTPNIEIVDKITDSIWYARGNEYPFYNYWDDYDYRYDDEEYIEYEGEEYYEEEEIEYLEEEEYNLTDEMEIEENTSAPKLFDEMPEATDDPNTKNYYELRDSIDMVLQELYLVEFSNELFINQNNLIKNAPDFRKQLSHDTEGIFYTDNSRNFGENSAFYKMKRYYPQLFTDIKELYTGNIMMGDLKIENEAIVLDLDVKYGEKLGSIYQKLTDTKFDKNVLKYIPENNSGFFTYNVNLREAYEQSLNVIKPILENESNRNISANLLALEIFDEFVNKDALFDTYKGSMFGVYSGIRKVKTEKLIFDYDEETFDYTEEWVESMEDMPIFTLGFSTDRNDIPSNIMKRLSKMTDKFQNKGDYWLIEDGMFNSVPMYLIMQNNLFIVTNDEDLAVNNAKGYGSASLSKSKAKFAQKSGVMYAYSDLGKAIETLPRELFSQQENEMLDVLRGKSGKVTLTSSATTKASTAFKLNYNFNGDFTNSGTYILDLINSLYVLSK